MDPSTLEAFARRAVDVVVQERDDPRLLVVTKRRLPKPPKAARLLAALTNAADDRTALLIVGMRHHELHGLASEPPASWWEDVRDAFPAVTPNISWTMVDFEGVRLLVITTDPVNHLVTAYRRDRVVVPWVDDGRVVTTRPGHDRDARAPWRDVPTSRILGGWIERCRVERAAGAIDTYRGQVDIELEGASGTIADSDSTATLLLTDHRAPIELAVQIHPADSAL
ncbi:MAG: hypothetical protein ACC660_07470, partial [Acidimicrobiales bacterium]